MTTRVALEEGTASAPMEVPEMARTYPLTSLQPLTWPRELAAKGVYPYGGGGGGLLVDGEGPLGIVEPSQGQGFGGGGYSHHGGLQGVILMEVDTMDM